MKLSSLRVVFLLYAAVAVVVTLHRLSLPPLDPGYPRFNNFHIFRASFFHLIQQMELYIHYPEEHWDLYKYTPTFSLLMGPLAILPFRLGAVGWSLLNSLLVFFSLEELRVGDGRRTALLLLYVLVELTTNMQNSQSNGLMAGLMIFGLMFLDRGRWFWAAFFLVLSVFVKPFGLVAFPLALLYPNRRQFVLATGLWFVILALLPLVVVSPGYLVATYRSWLSLLVWDQQASLGINVMAWLETWFRIRVDKMVPLGLGALFLLVSIWKWRRGSDRLHRLWLMASVLLWVVIFNHKAESPTFIIAMCGVGIWYFSQPRTPVSLSLALFALVFTSLSPTDIFPRSLRESLVYPYYLKGVPCIFVWFKITYDLLRGKPLESGTPVMIGESSA